MGGHWNSKVVLISICSLYFLGCSETSFKASSAAKASKLASSNIMDDGNETDDAGDTVNLPDESNITRPIGEEDDPINDATVDANSSIIERICSNSSSKSETNLKLAEKTGKSVQLRINGSICSSDRAKIMAMVRRGKLTKADVQALCPSKVTSAATMTAGILVEGKLSERSRDNELVVLWARNSVEEDDELQSGAAAAPIKGDESDQYCDRKSSPLVVHLASNPDDPKPVALSSRADGVFFDLLGANNNYIPVKISWFTNSDYHFLALPDRNGDVKGIDQLFGDNTRGPDGGFAANGYAALAKHDDNRDGVIDANDAIFRKLRLWLDKNRNARSDAGELTSLRQAKIAYIDLEFSDEYEETDIHGNQTKMKSVVGLTDGSLDLIFDLWFAY